MVLPPWREEGIARYHRRGLFDCGVPDLNEYLQRYARQSHDRRHARTFVAVPEDEPTRILGYYTLRNASVEYNNLPEEVTKGLPRYPSGAILLARLARDLSCKGLDLGPQLLLCAGERAIRITEDSGADMLLIDAKDEKAACWYRARDAFPLLDDPLRLVIPLESIRRTIDAVRGA